MPVRGCALDLGHDDAATARRLKIHFDAAFPPVESFTLAACGRVGQVRAHARYVRPPGAGTGLGDTVGAELGAAASGDATSSSTRVSSQGGSPGKPAMTKRTSGTKTLNGAQVIPQSLCLLPRTPPQRAPAVTAGGQACGNGFRAGKKSACGGIQLRLPGPEERPYSTRMSSRGLLTALLRLITAGPVIAEDVADSMLESYQRRQHVNRVGMIVLGGWAVGNIVLGSVLSLTEIGDSAFHQMNALWNTVNLGLATAGLVRAFRGSPPPTFAKEIRAQHSIEKILLLNAGLDGGYMAFGLYLMQLKEGRFAESYPGWGRSLVLQGSFLLAFDLVMYLIHRQNRAYERALPASPTSESG